MLVIERQTLPRILELLREFGGVRVVVSHYSLSKKVMQCQGVTNTVRNVVTAFDTPGFDLDPIAVTLIDDGAIEQEQRFKAEVLVRDLCII